MCFYMENKMILFYEDWYKQNAVIHETTTNLSFIKMSFLLEKLGIKNNKFMLALHQPELLYVDPRSLS